ncbi:hypothetical protein ACXY88_23890, partial [Escherichia coli]
YSAGRAATTGRTGAVFNLQPPGCRGSIATGLQDAVLTVRKDAAFGVTVNGVSAMPGESKELQLDLGLGDSRSFPIFPAVSGLTGRSEFMINIEELK